MRNLEDLWNHEEIVIAKNVYLQNDYNLILKQNVGGKLPSICNQKPGSFAIVFRKELKLSQEVHFSSNQEPKPEPGTQPGNLGLKLKLGSMFSKKKVKYL